MSEEDDYKKCPKCGYPLETNYVRWLACPMGCEQDVECLACNEFYSLPQPHTEREHLTKAMKEHSVLRVIWTMVEEGIISEERAMLLGLCHFVGYAEYIEKKLGFVRNLAEAKKSKEGKVS